jgi:hypothetical protein
MLTLEDFTKAGYARFETSNLTNADFGLQKKFKNEVGVQYFITIIAYEYRDHYTFAPDAQFQQKYKGNCINVEFICNANDTVNDIEIFYERMWRNMDFDYYERNL